MKNFFLATGICYTLSTSAFAQTSAPRSKAKSATDTIILTKASPVTIVLPTTAIPAEETGATELKNYLNRITGANCQIVREDNRVRNGPTIYVGATNFAARHSGKPESFAYEEWLMQTQGKTLILTGSRPRGTLYAVYRFLEDVCGVRWWNPWEESVPVKKTLSFPALKRRGKPAFNYRDIYAPYAFDGGRFAARSRLNRQGFEPIGTDYGGGRDYGPPDHVHTFYPYLPPEKYYKDHPDWYTVRGDEPPTLAEAHKGQLCLANKEMRAEFLRVLRENIRTSRQAALVRKQIPPDVYEISQNDGGVTWVCGEDVELVKREGSPAASMINFVNYLADGIKDEFPDVYLSTLAYHSGEKAPKTIRPRDNVIVRLTDTRSNVVLPITAPRNHILRENVEAWSKLSNNLRIWDYNVTYAYPGFPTPNLRTYATDLRFLLRHGVKGFTIEFQFPIESDMRDLKMWVLCKLLEDPTRNPDVLIRQFTDGFYGAAGSYVRQYLALLNNAVDQQTKTRGTPEVTWFAGAAQFSYLNLDFLQQGNHLFDRGAAAVAKNPILSRRLRHARYSLDYAILKRYLHLTEEWVRTGHPLSSMPLDRDVVAKRFSQVYDEQIALRIPADGREAARKEAAWHLDAVLPTPKYAPIPDKFKDIPLTDIFTYGVHNSRYTGPDPLGRHSNGFVYSDDSVPGKQVRRLIIPDNQTEKYKLPMPWGVYADSEEKTLLTERIKPEDVPGPGFHWYRLGVVAPTQSSYLFLTWSWYLPTYIGGQADVRNPDQKFEIWASLSFEGPIFPHGESTDKNAVVLERVVLIRQK